MCRAREEMQMLRWDCVQRIQLGRKTDESATQRQGEVNKTGPKNPKVLFHFTYLSHTLSPPPEGQGSLSRHPPPSLFFLSRFIRRH